jgi:hypothetical protein
VCAPRSFPAGALIECIPCGTLSPASFHTAYNDHTANNDCSPANVELRGGPTQGTAAVHALRDITAGEPLLVQHGPFFAVSP